MDFLVIDLGAIAGESNLDGYVGKVEVLSWSHGVSQPVTGDASNNKRTSGRPVHSDFSFTKYVDLATASITDYCNQATPLPTVTFTVGQTESGKTNPYWVVTMSDVVISSVSFGGGGGGKPTESVTLNYAKISWAYKQQTSAVGDKGTASAKWDLTQNKAA